VKHGVQLAYNLSLDGDAYDSDGMIIRDSSTRMTNVDNTASLFGAFQEVIVDRYDANGANNPYATDTGLDGMFTINAADKYIRFEIDVAGTDIENWSTVALRWTMTCANDVIEGEGQVPEPAILGLLAIGLLGLGFSKRKNA